LIVELTEHEPVDDYVRVVDARPPGSLRNPPALSINSVSVFLDMTLLFRHAYTERRTLPGSTTRRHFAYNVWLRFDAWGVGSSLA
jgi:hypothetical protein